MPDIRANLRWLSDTLAAHGNARSVIACVACTVLFMGAIGSTGSGDKVPLDLLFYYTPETAYSMIESYGEEGRAAYRLFELTTDLAWPVVYTLTLSLVISWLFQGRSGPAPKARILNLLPFGAWLFDLLENALIVAMLSVYPERPAMLAWAASAFTMAKWIFASASFLVLLAGVIYKWSHRHDAADRSRHSVR